MALFRTSAIVGAISGNLGGQCFVASAKGNVVRRARRITRSTSQAALQKNATFLASVHRWRTFSDQARQAWEVAASNYPITNRLGVTSYLSGYALYLKLEKDSIAAPAGDDVLPPSLVQEAGVEITTLTMEAGVAYKMQCATLATTAYNLIQVHAWRPMTMSPIRFVRQNILVHSYSPITTLGDFTVGFDNAFGAPIAGETISVTATPSKQGIVRGPTVHQFVTVT